MEFEFKPHQRTALSLLAADPTAFVEAGTLGFLRRHGLAGKVVGADGRGRQKTTSPLTKAGESLLAGGAR